MAIYVSKFKLIDSQNRTVNHQVIFDVLDEATLLAALTAFLTDLQAITDLGVVKYTYSRDVAVNEAAGAGSNVDVGATFTWATPLPINPTTQIPGIISAALDGQGGVDLTNALIVAWADNYITSTARLNINNPTQPTALSKGVLNK